MEKKKYLKLSAIFLCLILIGTSLWFMQKNDVFSLFLNKGEQEEEIIEMTPEIREKTENELLEFYESKRQLIEDNYNINDDYQGQFIFESGIIDEGVVQTYDNDFYLRKDWVSKEYSAMGSIIMDYECDLSDRNITLYGHMRMDYELKKGETDKFTPLKKLLNEKDYKKNRYAYFISKGEIRKYLVADVFLLDLEKEGDYYYTPMNMEYYLTEFDPLYFVAYKENIKNIHAYDTGVSYSSSDNLLTLQTCVEGKEDSREIVILKEIARLKCE